MYMKIRKYFILMIVGIFLLVNMPTVFGEDAPKQLCPGEGVSVVASGGFYSATPASNAIDGDFTTIANTGATINWYVIDLGAVHNVGTIKFYGRPDRLDNLYNIYGSDDNTNYEKVLLGQPTASSVTVDGTSYALFLLDVPSRARYIKIASAQAQYTRIFSTEIYESETETPTLDAPTNLKWSGTGTLSWDAVSNATSYDVILYKNDIFVQEYRGVTATTLDMTADMRLSGAYTATVVANAEGYISTVTPSESDVNQYVGIDNLTYDAEIVAGADSVYWYASNMPTLLKDGNYETYATTQMTNKGFVVLDLGALYDVNTIDLYTLTNATDFEVYYSDDGTDYEKAKFSDLITNKGIVTISKVEMYHYSVVTNFVARYIKLAEETITRTYICEAEIFGTPVCAQTLETPQAPVWSSDNILTFTGIENASSYVLRLYKDGALIKVYEDLTDTTVDCSDEMKTAGLYSATVFAKAEGYNASATSELSSVNDYLVIGNIALAENGTAVISSSGYYGSTPAANAIDGSFSTYARTNAAANNFFVLDFGKTNYIQDIEGYSAAVTLKNIYDVYYSNSSDNYEENYAGQLTIRSETINGTAFLVYSMPICVNARYLKIVGRGSIAAHFEEFEVYGATTSDSTSYLETLYTTELTKLEELNSYTKYILPQAEAPYTCTYSVSDSGSSITGNILKVTNNGAKVNLTMSLNDGTHTFTTTRVISAPTAETIPVYVILTDISKTSDTTASVYALLSNDNIADKKVTAVVAQYKDSKLLGVQLIDKNCDAFASECELNESVAISAEADTVKLIMLGDAANLMPISDIAIIQ